MREVAYCNECGGRMNLYVVGVCPQCDSPRPQPRSAQHGEHAPADTHVEDHASVPSPGPSSTPVSS